MKVYFFHLMPYADLDLSQVDKHGGAWVTLPNTNFDSGKGRALYEREHHPEPVEDEHVGFEKLEHEIAAKGGAENPAAVAAAIGRKKYGEAEMAKKSAAGLK